MYWWVISSAGALSEPIEIEGWKSMGECETAAESFVMLNPKEKATFKFNVMAMCVEVPK